ncbi:hypothetical protein OQA88_5841 [Cercophora sp. LCS_1]
MEKCGQCRKDKKKERDPSQPCDRCRSVGAQCSPSTRKKRRTGDDEALPLDVTAIAPPSSHGRDRSPAGEEDDTAVASWPRDQLIKRVQQLEEENKNATEVITSTEQQIAEMEQEKMQLMQDVQTRHAYICDLERKQEEMIATHTIETGELRKKISVLTNYVQTFENAAAPAWTHDQIIDAISVLRLVKMRDSIIKEFQNTVDELFGYDAISEAYRAASLENGRDMIYERSHRDLFRITDQLLKLVGSRLDELKPLNSNGLSPEVAALMHARRQIILPEVAPPSYIQRLWGINTVSLDDLCSSNDLGAAFLALLNPPKTLLSDRYIQKFNSIFTTLLHRVSRLPDCLGVSFPKEILDCPVFFDEASLAALGSLSSLGAMATQRDCTGSTILHILVGTGQSTDPLTLLILDKVLKAVEINEQDLLGRTALHLAVGNGPASASTARMLMREGADPTLRTIYGHTPLHYAAALGNTEVCQLIIDSGFDANPEDITGRTPLFYAISRQTAATTKLLIQHISPGMTVDWNPTNCLLYEAVKHGTEETALEVMSYTDWKHSPALMAHKGGATLLHLAVNRRSRRLTSTIMKEMGDQVNAVGLRELPALSLAVELGDLDIVQLLLSHPRVDAGALNAMWWTPLHFAARKGDMEIAQVLAKRRDCGLLNRNKLGHTAYDFAVHEGHVEIAEMLKELMEM